MVGSESLLMVVGENCHQSKDLGHVLMSMEKGGRVLRAN
jgi:hypothetical protein